MSDDAADEALHEKLARVVRGELRKATDEELDNVRGAIAALYPDGPTPRQALAVLIHAAILHRIHGAPDETWAMLADIIYDGISVEVIGTRPKGAPS